MQFGATFFYLPELVVRSIAAALCSLDWPWVRHKVVLPEDFHLASYFGISLTLGQNYTALEPLASLPNFAQTRFFGLLTCHYLRLHSLARPALLALRFVLPPSFIRRALAG